MSTIAPTVTGAVAGDSEGRGNHADGWVRHWPLAAILTVTAIVRIGLAYTTQRGCAGDGATTGLMALHILRDGERPLYCWGALYSGGTAFSAYVAALYFRIGGVSEFMLKLVPITFSLVALGLVYALVLAARGRTAAVLAALAYASGIPLMVWVFDPRGAYPESQVLLILGFMLLYCRGLDPRGHWGWTGLLGIVCGFGYYILELMAPAIVFIGLVLAVRHGRGFFRRRLAPLAAGALIGWSPALYYNLTHQWENAIRSTPGEFDLVYWGFRMVQSLWVNFSFLMPRLFQYNTAYAFPLRTDAVCWIEYGFLLACLAVVGWTLREPLQDWLGQVRRRRFEVPEGLFRLEALLLLYVAVFFGVFCAHPDSQKSVRYLLYLEPALSILTAIAIDEVYFRRRAWSRRWLRAALGAVLILIVGGRLGRYVEMGYDSGIQGLRRTKASLDLAPLLIAWLDTHGATRVAVEDYDLRMRMNLLTRERIICAAFPGGWSRNPFYEEKLAEQEIVPAIVTYGGRKHAEVSRLIIRHQLEVKSYRVDDRVIYFSLPLNLLEDWRSPYEW